MKIVDPIELLQASRFDLVIKYLYVKSIINNYDTDIFKHYYKEHLYLWGGGSFKEYGNPYKDSFEKFDSEFKKIIKSISEDGFDSDISTIPTLNNKYILNGSHRTAASLYLNKKVSITDGLNGRDGVYNCNWDFFKRIGLSDEIGDRVAVEYSKLKKNTYVALTYPSGVGKKEEVIDILNKYGNIYYYRDVNIYGDGKLNLMKELYYKEPWGGNYNNGYLGLKKQSDKCYPVDGLTRIFLVEFDSLDISVKAKSEIREMYGIGKPSIHINDTHDQTVRISKSLFNKNSIDFINGSGNIEYTKNIKMLESFKNRIHQMGLDIDDFCVTSSSILSLYGLREAKDVDFLHRVGSTDISNDLFGSHNSNIYYNKNIDDIIYNPNNHFYNFGIKFANMEIIRDMKVSRGEDKDIRDINLIDKIR